MNGFTTEGRGKGFRLSGGASSEPPFVLIIETSWNDVELAVPASASGRFCSSDYLGKRITITVEIHED